MKKEKGSFSWKTVYSRWLTAREMPRIWDRDWTFFHGWGTRASRKWRAWSGPNRNGL